MKTYIENVITEEEANSISTLSGTFLTDHPIVSKIKGVIEQEVGEELDWKKPSDLRIERNGKHDWHVDTGGAYNNPDAFMKWCDYGCSVLLHDHEDPGFIEYRDGTKLKNYLGLVIHSSDVEHKITSYSGERLTLLAFVRKA
jgi:hypothetical protein